MGNKEERTHVFGPVFSRRLGRSLGVDLVPLKTCTYDCVYCQIGRTTDKTARRENFVAPETVLGELKDRLDSGAAPDYITFSGSGEPTLHSELGNIISGIKRITDIPVAVITNGSLLWMPEVRNACAMADLVIPSLDAASEETAKRINRPDPSIPFEKIIEGLIAFRQEFSGRYHLEVMLLDGITEEEVDAIARLVEQINPDRVEVNTPVRPAAEAWAKPIPRDRLNELAKRLAPDAVVIAHHSAEEKFSDKELGNKKVVLLDMLKRRPCNLEDVAFGLGIQVREAEKLLERLEESGSIRRVLREGFKYYVPAAGEETRRPGDKETETS